MSNQLLVRITVLGVLVSAFSGMVRSQESSTVESSGASIASAIAGHLEECLLSAGSNFQIRPGTSREEARESSRATAAECVRQNVEWAKEHGYADGDGVIANLSGPEVDALNQEIGSKVAEYEALADEKYDIARVLIPNFEAPQAESRPERVPADSAIAPEAVPATDDDPWSVVWRTALLAVILFAAGEAVQRRRRAKREISPALEPKDRGEYFGIALFALFATAFLTFGILAVAFFLDNFVDGALDATWRNVWLVFGLLFGILYWLFVSISKSMVEKKLREEQEERLRLAQLNLAEEEEEEEEDEHEYEYECEYEEELEREREEQKREHQRKLELLDLRNERERERAHQKQVERERLERERLERDRNERERRAEKDRRERESLLKDQAVRERDRARREEERREREAEHRRKDDERRERERARREKAEYERRERQLEIVYKNKSGTGFHTMPGGSSAEGARMFAETHVRSGAASGYVIRNKNGKVVGSG